MTYQQDLIIPKNYEDGSVYVFIMIPDEDELPEDVSFLRIDLTEEEAAAHFVASLFKSMSFYGKEDDEEVVLA